MAVHGSLDGTVDGVDAICAKVGDGDVGAAGNDVTAHARETRGDGTTDGGQRSPASAELHLESSL